MGDAAFAVPDVAASGFVRVVTHPRVFREPDDTASALAFIDRLHAFNHAIALRPGERHWGIFSRLCLEMRAVGNTVPDAYLAALAIESSGELATADRGFARFPGVRWSDPAHAG